MSNEEIPPKICTFGLTGGGHGLQSPCSRAEWNRLDAAVVKGEVAWEKWLGRSGLGEVVKGEVVKGEVVKGEVVKGEVVKGEVVKGEVVKGEVVKGATS